MERQDRLLPTPMPPEEKQALRAKAKEDALRGIGLAGTDILGSVGDIGSMISKYLPVAGGQTIDDLITPNAKKEEAASDVIENGIGAKFFQKMFDIKPEGGFAETLFRVSGSMTPLPISAAVNTLKTPTNLKGLFSPSMITPDGTVLKVNDVPRTTAEILMNKSSGAGGSNQPVQKLNIDKKVREINEVTPSNKLSTDNTVYSRLILDLENINKPKGLAISPGGETGNQILAKLKQRPTYKEAEESGLVAFLKLKGDQIVDSEFLLRQATQYKPRIETKVYSDAEHSAKKAEKEQLIKDGKPVPEQLTSDIEAFNLAMNTKDMQLIPGVYPNTQQFKQIAFYDPTEKALETKQLIKSGSTKTLKGINNHDYMETQLSPGYIGHSRVSEAEVANITYAVEKPNGQAILNEIPGNNVRIVNEQQSNLSREKDKIVMFDKKSAQDKALKDEYDKIDKLRFGSTDRLKKEHDELLEEAFLLPMPEKNTAINKIRNDYMKKLDELDSPEVRAEKDLLEEKLSKLMRDRVALTKNAKGKIIFDRDNPPKRVISSEDRFYYDEALKLDKEKGIGYTEFRNNLNQKMEMKDDLIKEEIGTTLAYEAQIQKTNNVSKTAFKGSRAITEAERKKNILSNSDNVGDNLIISPKDLTLEGVWSGDSRRAKNPLFNFLINNEGGVDKNFVVKLAQNQIDGKANSFIDFNTKTGTSESILPNFLSPKKDNSQLLANAMRTEAENFHEAQRIISDVGETIRSNDKFFASFDASGIRAIKDRMDDGDSGALRDFKIMINDAIDDAGINLDKVITKAVEDSIRKNRRIPAIIQPQNFSDPVRHKKQAIEDIKKRLFSDPGLRPNKVETDVGTPKLNDVGRPIYNIDNNFNTVPKLETKEMDMSLYSPDNLDILEARFGGESYQRALAFAKEKAEGIAEKIKVVNQEIKEFTPLKFQDKATKLAEEITKKNIKDPEIQKWRQGFIKVAQGDSLMRQTRRRLLYKNAPFSDTRKFSEFATRKNIELAIQDGKDAIIFPARTDLARARQESELAIEDGALQGVYGSPVDNVLDEYVSKGAVLINHPVTDLGGNQLGMDPMRVLDIRSLKQGAIPRMAKGGLFEKFRKAS